MFLSADVHGVESRLTDPVAGRLSGGMKPEIGSCLRAADHAPAVAVESRGVGVDPPFHARWELWKLVSELAVGGMSVLWFTAYIG